VGFTPHTPFPTDLLRFFSVQPKSTPSHSPHLRHHFSPLASQGVRLSAISTSSPCPGHFLSHALLSSARNLSTLTLTSPSSHPPQPKDPAIRQSRRTYEQISFCLVCLLETGAHRPPPVNCPASSLGGKTIVFVDVPRASCNIIRVWSSDLELPSTPRHSQQEGRRTAHSNPKSLHFSSIGSYTTPSLLLVQPSVLGQSHTKSTRTFVLLVRFTLRPRSYIPLVRVRQSHTANTDFLRSLLDRFIRPALIVNFAARCHSQSPTPSDDFLSVILDQDHIEGR